MSPWKRYLLQNTGGYPTDALTAIERRALQVQHEQIHAETLRRLAAARRVLQQNA